MAISQNQKLRKKAEKDKRRKLVVGDKRKAEAAEVSQFAIRQMAEAARSPIRDCMTSPSLFEVGMSPLVLARTLPSGAIAVSVFLVDTFARGVKDAYFRMFDRTEYRDFKEKLELGQSVEPMEPSVARKLLQDAVAYARALGFAPHPEFARAEALFGDTPLSDESFTFGMNGKPLVTLDLGDEDLDDEGLTDKALDFADPARIEKAMDDIEGKWIEHEAVVDDDDGRSHAA